MRDAPEYEYAKLRGGTLPRARRLWLLLRPWLAAGLLVLAVVAILRRRELTGGREFAGVVVGPSYVYELPSKRVAGVALLLHGCGDHSAKSFWPSSFLCRDCTGLPAGYALVDAARRRNLVPLAVTSTDRSTGCWRSSGDGLKEDTQVVVDSLAAVSEYLQSYPGGPRATRNVYVVGISSGGTFASMLPADKRLKDAISGLVLQVSALSPGWKQGLTKGSIKYPPVAFVAMPRDKALMAKISHNRKELQQLRIPSTLFKAKPKAISTKYCYSQFTEPHASQCPAIVANLVKFGHLDRKHKILRDPRTSTWKNALSDTGYALGDNMQKDKSPLSEFMNTAYGHHEATGEFARKSFGWVERRHAGNRGSVRGDLTNL